MGKARPPGKSGVSGAPDSPPHRPHAGQSCFCSRVLHSYKLPPILGCSFLVTCRSRLQKLGSQGQLRASGGAFAPGETLTSAPPEATVRSTTMSQHGRSQARVGLGLAASPSLRVLARAMSGARGCKDLTFWAQALRVSEEMLTATPAFTFRSLSMGPSQHQKRGLLVLPSPLPAGDLGGQGAPGPGPHLGQWGYMGGGMPGGGGAASSGRGWAAPKWTARRPQHTSLGVPGAREPLLEVLWLWAVMQRLPGLPRCQLCTRLPQVDWAHGPLSLSPQKPRVHCKTRLLFSSSFRV